jgi:hypothetical protein
MQRPRDVPGNIPEPFLGNSTVNKFPQKQTRTQQWYTNIATAFSVVRAAIVATQRRGKHTSKRTEELCFQRGPCRGVIIRTVLGK